MFLLFHFKFISSDFFFNFYHHGYISIHSCLRGEKILYKNVKTSISINNSYCWYNVACYWNIFLRWMKYCWKDFFFHKNRDQWSPPPKKSLDSLRIRNGFYKEKVCNCKDLRKRLPLLYDIERYKLCRERMLCLCKLSFKHLVQSS